MEATERPDALDAFTSILLSPRTELTFNEMLARLKCPVCLAYGELLYSPAPLSSRPSSRNDSDMLGPGGGVLQMPSPPTPRSTVGEVNSSLLSNWHTLCALCPLAPHIASQCHRAIHRGPLCHHWCHNVLGLHMEPAPLMLLLLLLWCLCCVHGALHRLPSEGRDDPWVSAVPQLSALWQEATLLPGSGATVAPLLRQQSWTCSGTAAAHAAQADSITSQGVARLVARVCLGFVSQESCHACVTSKRTRK